MKISVLDYGLGNCGSVVNMIRRLGADAVFVSTPEQITSSDRLLVPGVGRFDAGVEALSHEGRIDAVREFARAGKPLLGICLGMQLLLESSDEGRLAGLGLIRGRSVRFVEHGSLRVPHMGWNRIRAVREDPLIHSLDEVSRFYFLHSYHAVTADESDVLATTHYGLEFPSVLRRDNVMGAQFHPEKSHDFGKQLLRNFVNL